VPAPHLELSQEFLTDSHQDIFQWDNMAFGGAIALPHNAHEETLKEFLSMPYLDPAQKIALQNEVSNLKPQDIWAIPLLIDVLKKEGNARQIHALAATGLGNIGPGASVGISAILDASMEQAAILGDYTQPMLSALAKIDPDGRNLAGELPEFEKRHYAPSAQLVSKEIRDRLQIH